MNTEGKSLIFFRSIIVILFISLFYLNPVMAQKSDSGTESHLVGTCQVFTKLQNEKLNIEKRLNETKQNFLPNLILEKSLTLRLDDLNSKLALFANDNEFTKLQNEKLNIEKRLNETKQNFLPNLILEKSLTLRLDDLNSKLALFANDNEFTKLQNEKLNIEKRLNETKQNFLPNLILEKSLTLRLDDLNSKLAFLTDNRYCSDLEKHIEEQN